MKIIKKSELAEQLGKPSFWLPKRIVGLCPYIIGIDELDEVKGERPTMIANIEKFPNGLGISVMNRLSYLCVAIKSEDIKSITLERGQILDQESKSVVGRALLGSLFGPVGMIIGGMSGLKTRIIKDQDNLIIIANDEGNERALLFQVKKGKNKIIVDFFRRAYPKLFSVS